MAEIPLRILITRRWPDSVTTELAARYDCVFNDHDIPLTKNQLIQGMQEFDILCPTVTDRIDAEVIGAGDGRVQLIANYGAGTDHIDLAAARQSGVRVSNTPDVLTDATADLALLLMLMASRRAGEAERELRAGRWHGWAPTDLMGQGLQGKTLGLVGLGRIGLATARRARSALSMRIVYHARRRVAENVERELEAEYHPTLGQLARNADVISLHCPGTSENHHLINASFIGEMKATAIVINTARGNIVDEQALAAALQEQRIAAAGLDVFENEPCVPEALLAAPNAVLLPHIGSATHETRTAMGMRVLENIACFIDDTALKDPVV